MVDAKGFSPNLCRFPFTGVAFSIFAGISFEGNELTDEIRRIVTRM